MIARKTLLVTYLHTSLIIHINIYYLNKIELLCQDVEQERWPLISSMPLTLDSKSINLLFIYYYYCSFTLELVQRDHCAPNV